MKEKYISFLTSLLDRYDIDNSGAIDKQEMLKVMRAIYAMVSTMLMSESFCWGRFQTRRKKCGNFHILLTPKMFTHTPNVETSAFFLL